VNGQSFYTEQNNAFGQWILFNFTKNRIDFNGYSILNTWATEQPSNWRIEVSDGKNWHVADTKSNEATYIPGKTFQTSTFHNVNLIKFVQTGPSGGGGNYNYVYISGIDFYGVLYFKSSKKFQRVMINQINFHYFLILVLHS
jgi:hypothetical protein